MKILPLESPNHHAISGYQAIRLSGLSNGGCFFAFSLVLSSFFCTALSQCQGLFGQEIPGQSSPGQGGSGGGNSSGLTVTASPTSMGLGHKVTLTLSGQAEGTEINWVRKCPIDNNPSIEEAGGECDCSIAPNNMIGFPRTPSIFDSPVNPGTYIYEATVGSEVAGAPVTIHPPNEATTTIGPNELFVFPSLGNNTRHQQTMKTVLKYNGNPLGKCASVCCSEKVKITVEAVHEKNLGKIAFNISAWTHPHVSLTNILGIRKIPTIGR